MNHQLQSHETSLNKLFKIVSDLKDKPKRAVKQCIDKLNEVIYIHRKNK